MAEATDPQGQLTFQLPAPTWRRGLCSLIPGEWLPSLLIEENWRLSDRLHGSAVWEVHRFHFYQHHLHHCHVYLLFMLRCISVILQLVCVGMKYCDLTTSSERTASLELPGVKGYTHDMTRCVTYALVWVEDHSLGWGASLLRHQRESPAHASCRPWTPWCERIYTWYDKVRDISACMSWGS